MIRLVFHDPILGPRVFRDGVAIPEVTRVELLPGHVCRVVAHVLPIGFDAGGDVATYMIEDNYEVGQEGGTA